MLSTPFIPHSWGNFYLIRGHPYNPVRRLCLLYLCFYLSFLDLIILP